MTDTLVNRAETTGLISKASFAEFPKGAPIHAAFRFIELRKGTQPPEGVMDRRVAFGTGLRPQEAALLAGFEAIERYALQFCIEQPETCESLLASDGETHVVSYDSLCIGAPGTNGRITSKGTAAGLTPDAAAMRAVFECLEHALNQKSNYTHVLPRYSTPRDLKTWLSVHLRQLEFHVVESIGVGLLIRAVCADEDGGRPTYGTAFSADLAHGVWRAAGEAVVSWRNMVALEYNGVTADEMDDEEARLFRLYRGARHDRPNRPTSIFEASDWRTPAPTLGTALAETAKVMGRPIAIFDMTAPELPLPVLKAVAT